MSVVSSTPSVHLTALSNYIECVCSEMGYTTNEVLGPSRKREIVDLRHLLMVITRYEFSLSTPRVGDYFNRNHATVVHACHKMKVLLNTNQIDLNLSQSLFCAEAVMLNQWGHKLKTIEKWRTQKK